MIPVARIAALAAFLLAGSVAFAQATGPLASGGLVRVKSKNLDEVYLLPGTDFRTYRKVLLKKSDVAFQRNWVRDVNSGSAAGLSGKVTDADAAKIVEAARTGVDEIWAEAFKSTGFQLVAEPGEDVLEVRPSVVDLFVNAPSKGSAGMSRTYTMEAGQATLNLEFRDSRTGAVLGRAHDRRHTGQGATRYDVTTSTTNARDFGRLFATWAVIAAKGLQELQAGPPLALDAKSGQKAPSR